MPDDAAPAPAPASAPAPAAPKESGLRQAVDFGGLLAFGLAFLVMRLRGMSGDEALVQATWFLVAGSAVGVAVGLIVEKRLALMPLLVGGFALVFGVLTLVFNDDLFVKLKVTVLNASLAIALLGGVWLGKQPLKALLGTVIPVNDQAWRILTVRYGIYFACVALTNEVVRNEALMTLATQRIGSSMDPADIWVSFRGVLWIASSVFGLSQVPLIMRNMISDEKPDVLAPIEPEVLP